MKDFDDFIIDLVRAAEPDLDERLEKQDEELRALECTDPTLGKWITTYDVEYLLAAFNLNDEDFAENFPEMSHLNHHDRSQIIEAFENHFQHCAHCYLKRGYDMEMNGRIESVYRKHGNAISAHLNATKDQPEPTVHCDEDLAAHDLESSSPEVSKPKMLYAAAATDGSRWSMTSLLSKHWHR